MIAFAYYRLPYLHHAIYVAQHEGEPEVLSSVAELNGKEGFVIAPFAPSSDPERRQKAPSGTVGNELQAV